MTSQSLWAGLSVQDFFQGYNWSGESVPLEPTVTDETADVPSLLCLKVQDFLGQANWRGEVITSKAPSPAQPLRPTAAFSLTYPLRSLCVLSIGREVLMRERRSRPKP